MQGQLRFTVTNTEHRAYFSTTPAHQATQRSSTKNSNWQAEAVTKDLIQYKEVSCVYMVGRKALEGGA